MLKQVLHTLNKLRQTELAQNEEGFVALEVGMALSLLMSVSMLLLNDRFEEEQEDRLKTEGELGRFVAKSMANYVYSARSLLDTNLQAGPQTVTVAQMMAQGAMPAGFSNTTQFGKSFYGVVRRVGPLQFRFLTCATGGTALSDGEMTELSKTLGAFGGGVYSRDENNFRANSAIYVEAISDYAGAATTPSSGDTCTLGFYGLEEAVPDYVSKSRTAGGAADMAVRLDMGDNDLQNVASVRFGNQTAAQGITEDKSNTLSNFDASTATGTASPNAEPNTVIERDANGRAKIASPVDGDDIATADFVRGLMGGGSSGWRPFPNYVQMSYYHNTHGSNYSTNLAENVPGDKLVRCSIHPGYMLDPNDGSDPYVRVSAYVYGGAQTYTLFQYRLIAWQTTYGRNTGTGIDSIDIHDLKLLDGEYLQIRWEGRTVDGYSINAYATCTYEVLE